MNRVLTLLVLVAVAAACGRQREEATGRTLEDAGSSSSAVSVVVDSATSIAEQLRRFRADLEKRPGSLENGATDRDSLVKWYVRALENADTAAFERMAVDRAEFAYLYYPAARVSKPPYELGPGLVWFRLQTGNRQGVLRALRDFGGEPLDYAGYRCDRPPVQDDGNRTWLGCVLRLRQPAGDTTELRLFGSILERDGRFKFLSYANGL